MNDREMIKFGVYFLVAATVLFVIFNFVFPYYRMGLEDAIKFLVGSSQISGKVTLTYMPFVAVIALILATPKQSLKIKAKYVFMILVLFFAIDVGFSIAQVLIPAAVIQTYQLLLMQDFLTLLLPIVFWIALNRKVLFEDFF
jgi:hypothetical protein